MLSAMVRVPYASINTTCDPPKFLLDMICKKRIYQKFFV